MFADSMTNASVVFEKKTTFRSFEKFGLEFQFEFLKVVWLYTYSDWNS